MRLTLAALALLASIATASAGWTCQQVGNFTYCTNTETGQRYTCQQVGNFRYCN